jgi:hypothetical protein
MRRFEPLGGLELTTNASRKSFGMSHAGWCSRKKRNRSMIDRDKQSLFHILKSILDKQ